MRVKIFYTQSNAGSIKSITEGLEGQVNAWLSEHSDIEVISITPSAIALGQPRDGELQAMMLTVSYK